MLRKLLAEVAGRTSIDLVTGHNQYAAKACPGFHVPSWLAAQARAGWGIEIEARHREAVHSALMTGVRHALARGLQDREALAEVAVDYVRTSVPDALSALRPEQQLIKMAEATLEGWRPVY